MEKYGSDKPDLRIDLTVQDATNVLSGCGFEPFAEGAVKAVVVSDFKETRKFIDKTLADVETQSGGKPYWFRIDESGEVVGGIAKFVVPLKDAVVSALGLKPGDFVALSSGKLTAAQKTAGVLVKTLGAAVPGHMQQHSGEHILSGILCSRFHCDNVGFHLGADTVTIDYNADLTWEDAMGSSVTLRRYFTTLPATFWARCSRLCSRFSR